MHKISLKTVAYQGQPVIGVNLLESFEFPFKVSISIGDVGGPSAGMMFALAIIDKLTPMNLTGGKFIAGTGEIDEQGNVSAIGGIQQKMSAAQSGGCDRLPRPGRELHRYARCGARRTANRQGQYAERCNRGIAGA